MSADHSLHGTYVTYNNNNNDRNMAMDYYIKWSKKICSVLIDGIYISVFVSLKRGVII